MQTLAFFLSTLTANQQFGLAVAMASGLYILGLLLASYVLSPVLWEGDKHGEHRSLIWLYLAVAVFLVPVLASAMLTIFRWIQA